MPLPRAQYGSFSFPCHFFVPLPSFAFRGTVPGGSPRRERRTCDDGWAQESLVAHFVVCVVSVLGIFSSFTWCTLLNVKKKIVLILLAPLVYPLSLRLLISTPNALRTKGMMYVHKGKEGLFPISLRKLSSLHPFFCLAALLFPCVHTPPRENCSVFDPPSDRDKASGNSRQTLMASYRMIFIYRKM